MKTLIKNWQSDLKNKKFVFTFLFALFFVIVALATIRSYLFVNEVRMGVIFDDPILKLFTPKDFTWQIFILEHTVVVIGLYLLAKRPWDLAEWGIAYGLMIFCRTFSLWLVPLEPPTTMIFLNDPVVSAFTTTITPKKDLFFSGHTATAFLIFLGTKEKAWKKLFLAASVVIGVLIVWQHVHYSIDVFAAPFVSFFCFKLSQKLFNKFMLTSRSHYQ